jgi:hypothetical protein
LNHVFSFHADGGELRATLPPVLCLHLEPESHGHNARRGAWGGGPTFNISTLNVTCLYPREGNCHAFVAGPRSAVLDILFPPYGDDDDRGCTYYERGVNA